MDNLFPYLRVGDIKCITYGNCVSKRSSSTQRYVGISYFTSINYQLFFGIIEILIKKITILHNSGILGILLHTITLN